MLMIISLFRRDVYIYINIKKKKQYIHEFSFLQKRLYSMFVSTKYVSTTVIMFVSTTVIMFVSTTVIMFVSTKYVSTTVIMFVSTTVIMFVSTKFVSATIMFLQRL